jgi:hypothetical protein
LKEQREELYNSVSLKESQETKEIKDYKKEEEEERESRFRGEEESNVGQVTNRRCCANNYRIAIVGTTF